MRDIRHIMFEGKKIQGYGKLGAKKPVQEGEAWRGSGREAWAAWRLGAGDFICSPCRCTLVPQDPEVK